jgi:hypothetical protein
MSCGLIVLSRPEQQKKSKRKGNQARQDAGATDEAQLV